MYIQVLRGFISFRDFIQSIDVLIIDTAVKCPVKGLDHHHFRTLPIVDLHPSAVQHPVMAVPELDTMPTIYRAFV